MVYIIAISCLCNPSTSYTCLFNFTAVCCVTVEIHSWNKFLEHNNLKESENAEDKQ